MYIRWASGCQNVPLFGPPGPGGLSGALSFLVLLLYFLLDIGKVDHGGSGGFGGTIWMFHLSMDLWTMDTLVQIHALAAGISESWDTLRICHFLVPPRTEHPGQKPIHCQTCTRFIAVICMLLYMDVYGRFGQGQILRIL